MEEAYWTNMDTANTIKNTGWRPWQPGESGNPSGRPKGTRDLANLVLAETGNGEELVAALLAVVRGEMPDVPGIKKDRAIKISDQLRALEMLLDRGFGKAPQHVELSGHVGGSAMDRILEGWTDEDLKAVVALRDRVRQAEIVEGTATVVEE